MHQLFTFKDLKSLLILHSYWLIEWYHGHGLEEITMKEAARIKKTGDHMHFLPTCQRILQYNHKSSLWISKSMLDYDETFYIGDAIVLWMCFLSIQLKNPGLLFSKFMLYLFFQNITIFRLMKFKENENTA